MENIYYVYLHIRLDTGEVFYVGKGHGRRAWDRHSRNRHWNFISAKTQWIASIVQDNMHEDDANLLEMWLIAKFRHAGVKLCNITEGGEGCRTPMPSLRKKVHCSNGMSFNSVDEAGAWANVSASKISSVINGRRNSSGGFSWWLDGDPPKEFVSPNKRMGECKNREVYRSDGVRFTSIKEAAESVSGKSSNIIHCANGKILTAYGYSWSYYGVPDVQKSRYERTSLNNGIPVQCIETGEVFPSSSHAAKWVRETIGRIKADGWPISSCAKGKSKMAYGHTWRYPE